MKNKEFQRRLVYDTLILLGVFTVILFMCRLWPLILLCILGLFAAMIRLLFLSRKETVIIQSVPQEPAKAETEKDLQQLAFELAIRRITERVTGDFPQARWVWKSQHAKEDILSGRDTAILLNQAGGYREAIVHIQNLQVAGITYGTSPEPEQEAPEVPEPDEEPVSNPDSQAAERSSIKTHCQVKRRSLRLLYCWTSPGLCALVIGVLTHGQRRLFFMISAARFISQSSYMGTPPVIPEMAVKA